MLFLKSRHYFYVPVFYGGGFPSGSEVKNLPAIAGDSGFYLWSICEVTNLICWLYFTPKIITQPLKHQVFFQVPAPI